LHIPTFIYRSSSREALEADNIQTVVTEYLLVVVDVDLGLGPVARRNLALEHDVNLAVRSTLHLRHAEVCSDKTDEASGAPNVTTLATDCEILLATVLKGCRGRGENLRLPPVGLSMYEARKMQGISTM
jgi:hypothetical protein